MPHVVDGAAQPASRSTWRSVASPPTRSAPLGSARSGWTSPSGIRRRRGHGRATTRSCAATGAVGRVPGRRRARCGGHPRRPADRPVSARVGGAGVPRALRRQRGSDRPGATAGTIAETGSLRARPPERRVPALRPSSAVVPSPDQREVVLRDVVARRRTPGSRRQLPGSVIRRAPCARAITLEAAKRGNELVPMVADEGHAIAPRSRLTWAAPTGTARLAPGCPRTRRAERRSIRAGSRNRASAYGSGRAPAASAAPACARGTPRTPPAAGEGDHLHRGGGDRCSTPPAVRESASASRAIAWVSGSSPSTPSVRIRSPRSSRSSSPSSVRGSHPSRSQRGAHEGAHVVAEPLARRTVEEPVAPGEPGNDRLPDRRRRLAGEPGRDVQERRHGRAARDGGRPGVVQEALTFPGREVRVPRGEPAPQLVVVEHANEGRAPGVPDHQRLGVASGSRRPPASTSTCSARSPSGKTWRTISGTGQVVSSSGNDGANRVG